MALMRSILFSILRPLHNRISAYKRGIFKQAMSCEAAAILGSLARLRCHCLLKRARLDAKRLLCSALILWAPLTWAVQTDPVAVSTTKPLAQRWAIQSVETYPFGKERFDRISEYFTGKENTGWYLYVRSDPESRPGYYFKVNLSQRCMDLPEGTQCIVEFIPMGYINTRKHTFDIPKSDIRYQTSVYLGFTGKDNPGTEAIAWRVTLMIPNEVPIVLKSPLWEMP